MAVSFFFLSENANASSVLEVIVKLMLCMLDLTCDSALFQGFPAYASAILCI